MNSRDIHGDGHGFRAVSQGGPPSRSAVRTEQMNALVTSMASALDKLKAGMESGPEGDPVSLTPAEATVVYRLLTEQLGILHGAKP